MDLQTKTPTLSITMPTCETGGSLIAPPDVPKIDYTAALFWLKEEGHYLFTWKNGPSLRSKFVRATDVRAAFSGNEEDTMWLPAGIVRAGSNAKGPFFVYSTPAQKVTVTLGRDEEPVTIPIPRIVLLVNGADSYLWAMKTDHFDPLEIAYCAPFPNVHGDGKICWGQNPRPLPDVRHARAIWDSFFATPFNGDLAGGKSRAHGDDVRKQLRELAGKNKYPLSDLADFSGQGRVIGSVVDIALSRG